MPPCPRYCPERTLPAGKYQPGRGPHPSSQPSLRWGVESWDGNEDSLQSNPGYLWGIDLYNHGYYWEAHEAWEDLWKETAQDSAYRLLLQGIIQCAGAALKASMSQPEACKRLADKGLEKLDTLLSSGESRYLGVDLRKFASEFREYCDAPSERAEPPRLLVNPPRPK